MKINRLNSEGFSHVLVLLLIVLGVAAVGTYYQVASQAQSRKTDRQKYARAILIQAQKGNIQFETLKKRDIGDKTTAKANIQAAMNGNESKTTRNCAGRDGVAGPYSDVNIDLDVLRFMYALSKQTDFKVTSIVGQCHSRGSAHYSGNAVDFGCPLNVKVADKVAKKYNMSRNGENCRQHGHYHYSK